MKHKHHIKPKHRGGCDADGVVEVSITCHAMFHWCEYQLHGLIQDKVAWLGLCGKDVERETAIAQMNRERMTGRYVSDTTRERMRQAKLGTTFKHTQQTKDKIGASNAVPIKCIELDITFNSAAEAARQLRISRSSISGMLRGDRSKVRYNGKWIKFEYLNNNKGSNDERCKTSE